MVKMHGSSQLMLVKLASRWQLLPAGAESGRCFVHGGKS
jgi:hypothetical protein